MKLLHLSDLHIGRRLGDYSLIDDQRAILAQLAQRAQDCDAVIVAGDVYDKSSPSSEVVRMVGDFWMTLARLQKPVLVISGNHDSAEQVAYCRELLEPSGMLIAPAFSGQLTCHTLCDGHGPVRFWLMPFLKPAMVRPFYPEVSGYGDAVRFALSTAAIDPSERNVLVAHQFVLGAQRSDSEVASVGGVDEIDASLFDAFDYVALGHLHSPQRLMGGRVCYCGSPLKYSLSEEHQTKAATVVTLGAKGELTSQSFALQPKRDVRTVRGLMDELCTPEKYSEDYVRAVVTDEGALIDPVGTLRVTYPNLLDMRVENSRTGEEGELKELESAESKTPMEHFADFYRAQSNDQPPDERRIQLMRTVIEEAEGRQHEAD